MLSQFKIIGNLIRLRLAVKASAIASLKVVLSRCSFQKAATIEPPK